MRIQSPCFSSVIARIAAAASDTLLLAKNDNRKGAVFYNEPAGAVLYLSLSANAASTTAYTVQIPAGGSWVLQEGDYIGMVRGIWASASGNLQVTELY